MKKKIYAFTGDKNIRTTAQAVAEYLENDEKMETQKMSLDGGAMVVQARTRHGNLKQWVGMDKAITVKLMPTGENAMTVEIGKGEWLKKGLLIGVGTFIVAWPLAVTSTIGMVKQGQLPGRIEKMIQNYLADLPYTKADRQIVVAGG